MSDLSIFDIAGPIMVGPSSSHTAGACKIGQFARAIFDDTPKKVTLYLHGSFAEVYKGHATDRALLGGVMGFKPSDPRLKNSFKLAKDKGIDYLFVPTDLGKDQHPNTVKIVLENGKHIMSVTGSSVGGGMVNISKLDEFNLDVGATAGKYYTLLIGHKDGLMVMEQVSRMLAEMELVVVNRVDSKHKHQILTTFSIDGHWITKDEIKKIETVEGVEFVRSLATLENQ